MDQRTIKATLHRLANLYPEALRASQLADIERQAFNIGLVLPAVGRGGRVCDIGGGIGLFSVACAALGLKAVLVDDFFDPINSRFGDAVLDLHRHHGVEIIEADVVNCRPDLGVNLFDAITSFDSIEHWHNSPKSLFRNLMTLLRDGGLFVLSAPNCCNLRKRICVPLGMAKCSSMEDWYEAERFRGHVREPDMSDLRYIARDMNLQSVRLIGRNWLGYRSIPCSIRAVAPIIDRLLRPFPQLCSDLYLVGTKPGA